MNLIFKLQLFADSNYLKDNLVGFVPVDRKSVV